MKTFYKIITFIAILFVGTTNASNHLNNIVHDNNTDNCYYLSNVRLCKTINNSSWIVIDLYNGGNMSYQKIVNNQATKNAHGRYDISDNTIYVTWDNGLSESWSFYYNSNGKLCVNVSSRIADYGTYIQIL